MGILTDAIKLETLLFMLKNQLKDVKSDDIKSETQYIQSELANIKLYCENGSVFNPNSLTGVIDRLNVVNDVAENVSRIKVVEEALAAVSESISRIRASEDALREGEKDLQSSIKDAGTGIAIAASLIQYNVQCSTGLTIGVVFTTFLLYVLLPATLYIEEMVHQFGLLRKESVKLRNMVSYLDECTTGCPAVIVGPVKVACDLQFIVRKRRYVGRLLWLLVCATSFAVAAPIFVSKLFCGSKTNHGTH